MTNNLLGCHGYLVKISCVVLVIYVSENVNILAVTVPVPESCKWQQTCLQPDTIIKRGLSHHNLCSWFYVWQGWNQGKVPGDILQGQKRSIYQVTERHTDGGFVVLYTFNPDMIHLVLETLPAVGKL